MSLELLKLEPGHTYVLQSDRHLTPTELHDIKDVLHDLDVKVLVLDPSLTMVRLRDVELETTDD